MDRLRVELHEVTCSRCNNDVYSAEPFEISEEFDCPTCWHSMKINKKYECEDL
jgi:hypothetical protein